MGQKVRIKTTTRRTRKIGPGEMQCNICHGTGKVKRPKRKKRG